MALPHSSFRLLACCRLPGLTQILLSLTPGEPQRLAGVVLGRAGRPWLVPWAGQRGSSEVGRQPTLLFFALSRARASCSRGVSFSSTSARPVLPARRGPSRPSDPATRPGRSPCSFPPSLFPPPPVLSLTGETVSGICHANLEADVGMPHCLFSGRLEQPGSRVVPSLDTPKAGATAQHTWSLDGADVALSPGSPRASRTCLTRWPCAACRRSPRA